MPIFNAAKATVISRQEDADLSKATLNPKLSAVDFDEDGKFFFMTIDRALFSNPVNTIQTVLDAHGFVPNLENMLSSLDSFRFSIHTRLRNTSRKDRQPASVEDYLPCLMFELPQKNRIGPILKSFYDEIAHYDTSAANRKRSDWKNDKVNQTVRKLTEQVRKLKAENAELRELNDELTRQLSIEQRSLSRASRALDSQQVLPSNARLGRIESIDLKRRTAKVKCRRSVIDIPTHLLDRVPDHQARCLITFDEENDAPLGIVFFNNTELADLDHRTAELLFVDGKTFKARDSTRGEVQIKAVNASEAATIAALRRGDKVVISISDGYVVRFSVLQSRTAADLRNSIAERFVVHDISKNQLREKTDHEAQAV